MNFYLRFLLSAAGIFLLLPLLVYGEPTSNGNSLRLRQMLSIEESDISNPLPRTFLLLKSQSVSPYILMHTGCREADHNGSWKRHAVKDAFGNLHVLYPVFDNDPTTNNRNQYNCLAAGVAQMSYNVPEGTNNEPHANPAQADQNGGLDVTPSGHSVWVGRGIGGNTGTIYNEDASSCLGLITTANTPVVPARGLDPDVRVVSAGASPDSIVVFISYFNANATIGSTRSLDGGVTWSVPIDCASSSFLNFAPANSASNPKVIHVFSTGLPDSSAFDDTEEILYVKSTDAGATWSPSVSVSGPYELPDYIPLFRGSLSSIMVGDTAHVFWLDRAYDSDELPGGHIHHLAITPDGSVTGPHKVADINLFLREDYLPYFGIPQFDWQHPTCAYNSETHLMYVLWSAPPDNGLGGYADSANPSVTFGKIFANNDIFCAASRNNGRSWDAMQNVTQTNHPGCDGTATPCEHEFYISAAEVADSVIYVVTQVQKFPGIYALGEPGLDTRLSDEWRLYLVPARNPVITARCKATVNPSTSSLHLIPGGPAAIHTVTIANTGQADLVLDSVRITETLNGQQLATTDNANLGTIIPSGDSYDFAVTFDPAGVLSSQSGLRSGQIITYTHTDDSAVVGSNVAISQLDAFVYVVPSFCTNSSASLHSATNQSDVFSQGAIGGPLQKGLFYPSGYNLISGGGVILLNPASTRQKLSYQYGNDSLLRCLSPPVLDSLPDGNGYYNLYVKSLASGLLDSGIIWENIFEQSTNSNYSDFLSQTVVATNLSGVDIPDVILGAAYDINVPHYFSRPENHSFDTSLVASSDGKTYRMLVVQGIAFSPPCIRTNEFYGAVAVPDGPTSASPVEARGLVAFKQNRPCSTSCFYDSLFSYYLAQTGYHVTDNLADSLLTGVTDSCPDGKGAAHNLAYVLAAKKVTLPHNTIISPLISRYGLENLAAGLDTLTLKGPVESFTVLHIASTGPDWSAFIARADSAISWYNRYASQQVGGNIGLFHRGDLDNNGLLTAADIVRELNAVFLSQLYVVPACAADLNFDGLLTAADAVNELNYVFIGTLPTPAYPPLPELLTCF